MSLDNVHPVIKRMIEEKALHLMEAPSSHSFIDKIFSLSKKVTGFFSGGSKKKDMVGLVERALQSSAKHLDLGDSFEVAYFVLGDSNLDKIIQYDLGEDLSPSGQQLVNSLLDSFRATAESLVQGGAHVAMLKPFLNVSNECLQSRIPASTNFKKILLEFKNIPCQITIQIHNGNIVLFNEIQELLVSSSETFLKRLSI